MGKRSLKNVKFSMDRIDNGTHNEKPVLADEATVDPTLAVLFASSAGPVKLPPKSRYQEPLAQQKNVFETPEEECEGNGVNAEDEDEDELSSTYEDMDDFDVEDFLDDQIIEEEEPMLDRIIKSRVLKPERKRKRAQEEELEDKYMQKLAKEEQKEEEERQVERKLKRQNLASKQDADISESSIEHINNNQISDDDDEDESNSRAKTLRSTPSDFPAHESLAPSRATNILEKASRTVFLANVSALAISSRSAKKIIVKHMSSFLSDLPAPPEGKPPHKVESIRFRSTAYAGTALPKKAAFAKKELMLATTKTTNAYLVYSTAYAAREAVKRLNGTLVLDRHLRVDGVAHPSKTDHRRCVFVGNLGFVDDESLLDQGGENERKRSKIPSDVEEGLWRQFSKAGTVESVRVVRDQKTRVGKGFAYVQFLDQNSVEAALVFNGKKYPPMLPRILRVTRAKAVRKTALASAAIRERHNSKSTPSGIRGQIYQPKVSSEQSSLHGRAGKLLGRAGAAQLKKKASGANSTVMGKRDAAGKATDDGIEGIPKPPESFIFEGYRASPSSGKPKDLKMGRGGGKKSKGKPRTRSARRAGEWKKGGARKVK